LPQKVSKKVKAVSPDLENYGLLSYLNPTRLRLPCSPTSVAADQAQTGPRSHLTSPCSLTIVT